MKFRKELLKWDRPSKYGFAMLFTNLLPFIALFACAMVLAVPANATPITYTLVIQCPPNAVLCTDPTGSLGKLKFGGANGKVNITFTFTSDTTHVTQWSVTGAHGFQNVVSTSPATIKIYSATTGKLLASATFKASAAIFVSVDQGNQGVGFGSGVPFPGQPVYPYANYDSQVHTDTYNLQSDWSSGLGFAVSCVGFPAQPCGTPISLPTSAGALILDAQFTSGGNLYCCATFTSQLH